MHQIDLAGGQLAPELLGNLIGFLLEFERRNALVFLRIEDIAAAAEPGGAPASKVLARSGVRPGAEPPPRRTPTAPSSASPPTAR